MAHLFDLAGSLGTITIIAGAIIASSIAMVGATAIVIAIGCIAGAAAIAAGLLTLRFV